MKTTIEVNGYEIKIEEMEGKIMVSAMKDEEVVEEFELEAEGMEGGEGFEDEEMEGDEMSAFGEEEMEEEGDFEGEDMDDEDMEDEMEEEEEDEMEDESGKLESFSYFVKRRKK